MNENCRAPNGERVGVDYYEYLCDVLPMLNSYDFPAHRVEELLPHSWAEARKNQKAVPQTA